MTTTKYKTIEVDFLNWLGSLSERWWSTWVGPGQSQGEKRIWLSTKMKFLCMQKSKPGRVDRETPDTDTQTNATERIKTTVFAGGKDFTVSFIHQIEWKCVIIINVRPVT